MSPKYKQLTSLRKFIECPKEILVEDEKKSFKLLALT